MELQVGCPCSIHGFPPVTRYMMLTKLYHICASSCGHRWALWANNVNHHQLQFQCKYLLCKWTECIELYTTGFSMWDLCHSQGSQFRKKIVHWTLSKCTPKSIYMLSTYSICITKTHLWPLISHRHYLEICILSLLYSLALSMDVGSVLEWLPCLHFTENMFLFSLILAQWFPKKATSKINQIKCLLQRSLHPSHC